MLLCEFVKPTEPILIYIVKAFCVTCEKDPAIWCHDPFPETYQRISRYSTSDPRLRFLRVCKRDVHTIAKVTDIVSISLTQSEIYGNLEAVAPFP